MRVIYCLMFLTMSLVALELIRSLDVTKKAIKLTLEKIETLKNFIDRYGK